MEELTFRYPSKTLQYGFVEHKFQVPDGIKPSEIAELYLTKLSNFQFQEVQLSDKLELDAETGIVSLGGKVVDTVDNLQEPNDAADTASAPWQKKQESSPKPWEAKASTGKAPKFSFPKK